MENISERSNNRSVDVELEVNNQLGDSSIFDEMTMTMTMTMNNERENVDLEARGPQNRQTKPTKGIDMYTMFQQLMQKINESTHNTEEKIKESTHKTEEKVKRRHTKHETFN